MATTKQTFISDLHLACAKDGLRPAMQCVHFKGGFAYASDAYIVVKQPLHLSSVDNMDILDGVSIHSESFKAIRKMKHVTATEDGFECLSKDGSKVFFQYSMEIAPDFEAVLKPKGAQMMGEIGVNPGLIGVLKKAMAGGDRVKMTFQGQGNAILFEPLSVDYEGEVALIMPIMTEFE